MYTPGPQVIEQPQAPVTQEISQPTKVKLPAKSKDGDIGSFIQQCIALCAH